MYIKIIFISVVTFIIVGCNSSQKRMTSAASSIDSQPNAEDLASYKTLYEQLDLEWKTPIREEGQLISNKQTNKRKILDSYMIQTIKSANFFTTYKKKAEQYVYKFIVDNRAVAGSSGHRASYKVMLIQSQKILCKAEAYISGEGFNDYGVLTCQTGDRAPLVHAVEFSKI